MASFRPRAPVRNGDAVLVNTWHGAVFGRAELKLSAVIVRESDGQPQAHAYSKVRRLVDSAEGTILRSTKGSLKR